MSLRQGACLLLVLTALLAILGEWSTQGAAQGSWRLPAALLLLGLAYERFETQRLRLRLTIDAPARWRLAVSQPVVMRLIHAARRVRTLQIAPEAPAGVELPRDVRTVDVAPDDGTEFASSAVPSRLGRHVWPVQRARVAGALGLAWWSCRLEPGAEFRVEPDVLHFTGSRRGLNAQGGRIAPRAGTGSQVDQLRDYQPGDPPRLVDWKASARRGELVSREHVDEQRVDVIVALDVGRSSSVWCGDLDRFGHYVNAAARFAEHAVAQADRVGLVAYAERPLLALSPTGGIAGLMRFRQALASLAPRPVDSNPLPAAARIRSLARQRSLIVLLTDVDDAASSSQLVGAVRLLQPKHLPFVVGLGSAALETFSRREARDWLDPYLALAAQIGEKQRVRSIRVLAAQGAPALITRPERLEREVFASYERFRERRRV